MAIENLFAKSIGAIKTVAEKASENDKGVIDFFAYIGKTISELVEAKDKLEVKVAQYENEFRQIKDRMEKKTAYYESELIKTRKKAAIIISGMVLLQSITLVLVIVLILKK